MVENVRIGSQAENSRPFPLPQIEHRRLQIRALTTYVAIWKISDKQKPKVSIAADYYYSLFYEYQIWQLFAGQKQMFLSQLVLCFHIAFTCKKFILLILAEI